jgi:hypothetical protein
LRINEEEIKNSKLKNIKNPRIQRISEIRKDENSSGN